MKLYGILQVNAHPHHRMDTGGDTTIYQGFSIGHFATSIDLAEKMN